MKAILLLVICISLVTFLLPDISIVPASGVNRSERSPTNPESLSQEMPESTLPPTEVQGQVPICTENGLERPEVRQSVEERPAPVRDEIAQTKYADNLHKVGPPFRPGGVSVLGPAAEQQRHPAVAFDGTGYFVVWEDLRADFSDLYGSRVNAGGAVLDPIGIKISTAPGDKLFPAIAYDGTNYLIAWQNKRGDISQLYATRISKDGAVLDPGGIVIGQATVDAISPAVAFDGTNYLIVWSAWRIQTRSYDICAARVSLQGVVQDPLPITVSAVPKSQRAPAVSFDGSNYLVVWEDARRDTSPNEYEITEWDIYGSRVSTNGTVLDDSAGIGISAAYDVQMDPSVSFDGYNYLVVWDDFRHGSWDIFGTRVTTAGGTLDHAGIRISETPVQRAHPVMAFADTTYLVLWPEKRDVDFWHLYGTRVSRSGVVHGGDGVPIWGAPSDQSSPALCSNGTGYLLAWEDGLGGYSDVYGTRLSSDGAVRDPYRIAIAGAANSQAAPAVAFDGSNYLVAWHDWGWATRSWDLYFRRVSPEGTLIDMDRKPLSVLEDHQASPSICYDGTNYFVVWEDSRRRDWLGWKIMGARVSPSGAVLDPEGVTLSRAFDASIQPSVAFDGTNYLVVWAVAGSCYKCSDIYGVRVSKLGRLVGRPFLICQDERRQLFPVVSFDGTNYLVVWWDESSWWLGLRGKRVSTDGKVLDATSLTITLGSVGEARPAIAFDGTNYLIVFQKHHSYTDWDICGTRVSPSGNVLDPLLIPISRAPGWQTSPVVTFDGGNYLVAWRDDRSGASDIYGTRVAPSGQVLDPDGVGICTLQETQKNPAIAVDGRSLAIVTYSSFEHAPYNSFRVWGSIWTQYLPVSATIAINPKTLNVQSQGRWLTCYIELPEAYDISDIAVPTVRLNGDIPAQDSLCEAGDYDMDGSPDLMLKFDRKAVASVLCLGDSVAITVAGDVGKERFSGTDYIRVIGRPVVQSQVAHPAELPHAFSLHVNPNPSNPRVQILYTVPKPTRVLLQLWNVEGRLIRTLEDLFRAQGVYSVYWDGKDEVGREVSSGLYFCRLNVSGEVITQKVMMLR